MLALVLLLATLCVKVVSVDASVISCRRCPSGSFLRAAQAGGGGTCGRCPPNSTTLDSVNATAAIDCVCVEGHTSDGGSCVPCAAASFKAGVGNHSCTACPANSVSAAGSSTPGACVCGPGYYLDHAPDAPDAPGAPDAPDAPDACVPCAPGAWKAGAGDSHDACLPCDAAAGSVPGATRAEQCLCNAGYAGAPGAACHACEAGKYRERGAPEYICADCPADTYNDQLAATLAVECTACAPHTSTLAATGARSARECACRGGYSRAAAWSAAAGWACRACAAGTYQPAGNQSGCERCAAGKYADQVAADADVCAECGAGSYAGAGRSACTACGHDTWVSVTGAGNCSACPPHSSLPRTGSSNVSDCECGAGFRVERRPHRCEPCAAGAYCPGGGRQLPCEGAWSAAGARACTPCAATSQPVLPQGMTAPTQCQCRPGTEGTHDSACAPCAPGSFQNRSDVDSSAVGFVAVAVACRPCPANTYQPAPGSAACRACPANSTSVAGSDGIDDCHCVFGFHSQFRLRAAAHAHPPHETRASAPGPASVR